MVYEKIENVKSQYISGIYCIESKCGKKYIGSAVKIKMRFMTHRCMLKGSRHDNQKLQNYVNKYGIECLKFYTLDICEINELIDKEQYYIDLFNPYFNIARVAGSTIGNKPWLGKKHSEETKAKIRATNILTWSAKPKKEKPIKLSAEENIERWRNINKTAEARKRSSDLHKGNKYWLGKKHKPETIEARKGGGNPRAKKVKCVEHNLFFDCALDACKYLGLSRACISTAIKRGHNVLGKYKFEYADD